MFGGKTSRKMAIGLVAAGILGLAAPTGAQTFSPGFQFLQAVDKKDRSKTDEMLGRPGSTLVNSRDISTGRTGLHIAADRRDAVWLVYLLNHGANPNIADNRDVTPLMRASQLGFFEGVQYLITGGAKVDEPNDTGETPLILAVHRRDTAMMRVLLSAGADADRSDNSGRSAREYAQLEGRNSTVFAEIERADAAGRRPAQGGTYGPSL